MDNNINCIKDHIITNTSQNIDTDNGLNEIVQKWLNFQKIIKEEITLHDISNYYNI